MKAGMAFVILTTIAVVGCQKQPTFEEAEQLYNKKDYVAAAAAFTPYAEQGDYRAQVYLGRHYLQKENLDLPKAASYFKKAADQGDTDAMYFLGMAYMEGTGVPQNADMGEQYLQKSAKAGSKKSTMRLCFIYNDKSQKTWQPADFRIALEWCEKAYQAGDDGGALMVGGIYSRGPLFDDVKANVWSAAYKLAANRPIDRQFDTFPAEQRIYLKAKAYGLYGEFGKNKPPVTYLDSLSQKR